MRLELTQIAPALALVVCALPAAAQHELVLTNHHVLNGKVVESTPDSVTFDHIVEGESVQVRTFQAEDIEPFSFYVVRKHATEGDAAAMVELGQYCLANDMSARARDLFERAAHIDPSIKESTKANLAQSRDVSAGQLLDKAKAYQAAGDPYKAWHTLQECTRDFGDTPNGQAGKELVSTYFTAYQDKYVIPQSSTPAGGGVLEEINKKIAFAAKKNSQALEQKNMTESLNGFKAAANEYKRVLSELDALAKKHADDADMTAKVAALETQAKSDCVQSHLNAAGIYLTREAFQDAVRETQFALAIDPDSSAAKNYRSRVASLSASHRW